MLLPRLAHTIARPRISLWLARHSQTPLRLVAGPPGSGKTTAVVTYLRARGLPFSYCAASPLFSIADFCADVAASLGFECVPGFDEFKEALRGCGPVQIAVDNIDAASAPLREWLGRLVEEAADNISFIYISRTWNAVDSERLALQGLAAVCDDRMLAFAPDEITTLAQALGVPHSPEDAAQLCEDTEGWPIVACGAVREAFEHGRTLAYAYDQWRKAHTYTFRQYFRTTMEHVDGAAAEAWENFLANGTLHAGCAEQLRRAGLPVRRDLHGAHFPYRVVEHVFSEQLAVSSIASQKSPPLTVRIFGEFEAAFGTQPVKWVRRRDQQIFLYLLLKENGSATRQELCEQFWPEAEPELRSASLRVACCNIRRAIGNLFGNAQVDAYFRSEGDIAVNFGNVTLDARRFRLHVRDAEAHYLHGNHQEALAHYRMAESLYGGRIGWCSQADAWVQRYADEYEALYAGVLRRLVALHRRATDVPEIEEYAAAASVKIGVAAPAQTARVC